MRVGPRMLVVAVSVVLATTVAGCDSSTEGQPTATDGESTSTAEETSSAEPTSSAPTFTNTQLCELLEADEAEQLGSSPTGEPGYSTSDGHPICQWTADTGLVVGFQEGAQSQDVRTGPGITNTETSVAGYTAVQSVETEPFEICQVLVDISDESLMSVSASNRSGGEGKYVPCDVANELANIVIPKATQR